MTKSILAFGVSALSVVSAVVMYFVAQGHRAASVALSAGNNHEIAMLRLQRATSMERLMLVAGGVFVLALVTGLVFRTKERRAR
jgi:hypothetical protein